MNYQAVIGLEIHAELKTKTKMFCDSLNDPDEKHPNQNVCPVCMGFPGTLPVINKSAVEHVLKVGLALGGEIPETSWFERKSYFYPDLPKGYQISQYEKPLASNAKLEIKNERGEVRTIRIRRIHLEEDTGRLIHELGKDSGASYVDFNRAGVPLMELVTEPDIWSAQEARIFAQELQLILRYLGASDADMERGQLRIEANVSLRPNDNRMKTNNKRIFDKNSDIFIGDSSENLGAKVEIKNLNSFRAVERAINYEITRQTEFLERGAKVTQETRGWDEVKQVTVSQRTKEGAEDYRYFPEPDLPPLIFRSSDPARPPAFDLDELQRSLPELPPEKRARFLDEYKFKLSDIEVLIQEPWLAEFYEEVVSELVEWERESPRKIATDVPLPQLAANWLVTDVKKFLREQGIGERRDLPISAENFAEFLTLLAEGVISSKIAKDLLVKMFKSGKDPTEIMQEEGIEQISGDEELQAVAKRIIDANPQAVADFKKGKAQALQFLIGAVMKETKGRANPEVIQNILRQLLQ